MGIIKCLDEARWKWQIIGGGGQGARNPGIRGQRQERKAREAGVLRIKTRTQYVIFNLHLAYFETSCPKEKQKFTLMG